MDWTSLFFDSSTDTQISCNRADKPQDQGCKPKLIFRTHCGSDFGSEYGSVPVLPCPETTVPVWFWFYFGSHFYDKLSYIWEPNKLYCKSFNQVENKHTEKKKTRYNGLDETNENQWVLINDYIALKRNFTIHSNNCFIIRQLIWIWNETIFLFCL